MVTRSRDQIYRYNDNATYLCDTGYEVAMRKDKTQQRMLTKMTRCTEDGTWSETPVKCYATGERLPTPPHHWTSSLVKPVLAILHGCCPNVKLRCYTNLNDNCFYVFDVLKSIGNQWKTNLQSLDTATLATLHQYYDCYLRFVVHRYA